jgi:hypothetical protein
MGSIKRAKSDERQLTEQEFTFVQTLNDMKTSYVQDMNHRISAILNNIAKTRMDYEETQDLQFELDFTDDTRTLKITKL